MLKLILVVALACNAQARKFNNPILDNADYPDPGTIIVDGVYYIVTTTNNLEPNKFPIHTSTDLDNWELAGYIFTENTIPSWSNQEAEFWAPEIHRVNNEYHVYFTSRDVADTGRLSIGVATSPNVLGPYNATDRPIYTDPRWDVLDSTILNDNGTLYFLWKGGRSIYARPINPDGLSFPSEAQTELFLNDLPWEDSVVEGPWYVRRNQYHYIFYSGYNMCSDLYRVGVARSLWPLGPYEKRGDPILASNDVFMGPGHNSVVKDLNGVDDIIVFHAWKKGFVCGDNPRLTLLANIGWGEDDWPYVYDF